MPSKARKHPTQRHVKIAIAGSGLTQRQASIDAAIPEARISAAIHGRGTLTNAEIRRLAGVLGVPAMALALSPASEEPHAAA
jgi:hypothetical protein